MADALRDVTDQWLNQKENADGSAHYKGDWDDFVFHALKFSAGADITVVIGSQEGGDVLTVEMVSKGKKLDMLILMGERIEDAIAE